MDEDLLLDLEELGGDEEELDDLDDGNGDDDAMEVTDDLLPTAVAGDDVRAVAKLSDSKQFKDAMQKIDQFMNNPRPPERSAGHTEDDPEYKLIVQVNNLTQDIDTEMLIVHKYIRDHYASRFPELESLVPNAFAYARTVKLIGNELDLTQIGDLKSILPQATVMVVTVTATTTNGQPLSEDALQRVLRACDTLLALDAAKQRILEYVESRMSFIAPNLSALIGSNIAAKLMGLSGGLKHLSAIPASNIIVLGKQMKMNTGMSSVTQQKHQGIVYTTDLVANAPQEFRRQAARILSAKLVLMARVDQAGACADGSMGRDMRDEVQKKIEVVSQPPPGKNIKALPIPDEGPKKRRAGKRFRKAKDRMAQTELSKAANRMQFGVAEDEVGFSTGMTKGLGVIGQQTGKIRAMQADARVKVGVAKKHQTQLGRISGGATSGFSSSVAFTPVKGIELENPELAAQRMAATKNDKYFGSSTFASVLSKKRSLEEAVEAANKKAKPS
ncbi:uncharacterized protein EV422DRAFT_306275 [Fimicolochytrium jonesii]|uniref:uncharacterized protein n=1 Tax=Fimicolochytrium jonesii TaxID=1396493 RepID=UPI0022FED7EA|nr:uncharacterized protein EV422DRAFT_306275 [Fimicolochytrium jonesii]KAI8824096.1 hypothetical protein EV422DRAFT_306275 [Fimicolochytrium jonesii]